ncbi:uncharacterized protein EV154DRAFT_566867 [Mucor mucedo]|uniref:uncharacterized protein n=1 Tax=Mucor mucedo TaxID=29922 RepID=UPI002220A534|nr:uncharacterized protein EV154DRAFT_566867 [Mucor mucedo]KAI7887960.1 hypothetical protein EV154DRAFT_566867 [Mucor mucedo]
MEGIVFIDGQAYEQTKEEREMEFIISEGLRMMEEDEREQEEFDLMYGDDQEEDQNDVQDDTDYSQEDSAQDNGYYDNGSQDDYHDDVYAQDAYNDEDDY